MVFGCCGRLSYLAQELRHIRGEDIRRSRKKPKTKSKQSSFGSIVEESLERNSTWYCVNSHPYYDRDSLAWYPELFSLHDVPDLERKEGSRDSHPHLKTL
jgi:hypothetical protein